MQQWIVPSWSSFNSRPHKEVDVQHLKSVVVHGLSIHDLTRRSTFAITFIPAGISFQFTTSQGGRRHAHSSVVLRYDLSIHDLTRRSTMRIRISARSITFQFTTSQGGRRRSRQAYAETASFNSRPHKEVDIRRTDSCF